MNTSTSPAVLGDPGYELVPLGGLVVRPGDTLIVRLDRASTFDAMRELHEVLMKRLPELADVIVLGADEIAVFRPDSESATKRRLNREVAP